MTSRLRQSGRRSHFGGVGSGKRYDGRNGKPERLFRAVRWAAGRFAPRALILMYHRIAEPESDPWELSVSPRHFAAHLEILKKYTRPMSLRDLVAGLQNGKVPRRAVVVTFDDGYADNLYEAKPLLERHNIPATVFLPTGHIGKSEEFWWDKLARLLLNSHTLPKKPHLDVNGRSHVWGLTESYDHPETGCRHGNDESKAGLQPYSRRSLYFSVYQLLLPLPEQDRQACLQEIQGWISGETKARPAYRTLSPEEVGMLGRDGLVEIGAHTITHPFLSVCPEAIQQREIEQGKIDLEAITGRQVNSFAYPHGDYDGRSVALVRQAGFVCACSIEENSVCRHSDPFLLPRFKVDNYHGEAFMRRLLGIWALK
jgi:peptidoglycan/xylan/chitin deacetylase (PgdA/CDA1 family)